MRTNLDGVLLILSWEQLRLSPYRDAVGKVTTGWGHLIQAGEDLNRSITRQEANDLFRADLAEKERGVFDLLAASQDVAGRGVFPVKLTDNQFSALVSFAFNVGVTALANSTLLKKIRARDLDAVPAEFMKWTKGTVGGVKRELRGLVERRRAEVALWGKG